MLVEVKIRRGHPFNSALVPVENCLRRVYIALNPVLPGPLTKAPLYPVLLRHDRGKETPWQQRGPGHLAPVQASPFGRRTFRYSGTQGKANKKSRSNQGHLH